MNIEVNEKQGVTVFRLVGNLDTNTAPDLEEQLGRIAGTEARRILVDLADVNFVSSLGLRVFLTAARELAPGGGSLSLCGPNEAVRDTLDACGFSKLLQVFDSEQSALAEL